MTSLPDTDTARLCPQDTGVVISRAASPAPESPAAATTKPGMAMTLPIRESAAATPPAAMAGDDRRYRPRTFDYMSQLPFEVEAETVRDDALRDILRRLFMAIKAEDFAPGALFWSRQLQSWLQLKFEMPRALRAKLTKMYYNLALAPGLDPATSDRFVSMVVTLTRKYHYLKPEVDLTLDWRPLWNQFKMIVFPDEFAPHTSGRRKPHKQTWKLLLHCKTYFDPRDRKEMLEEFLPYFGTSELADAFTVAGLLCAFLPTTPVPDDVDDMAARPEGFFPALFHVWSLVTRSRMMDTFFIDLFCCAARDFLKSPSVTFSQYGIFTKDQSDHIFTAILRLTEVPVGQADSPYGSVDYQSGISSVLEKDKKRYPVAYMAARWVVNCLSDRCLEHEDSTMASLEGLIESVETFFHPSNQGQWTVVLGQLTHYLVELFILRWNREQSGELEVPQERRISPALRRRFVQCLREVVFMGLFCKSARVAQYYYSALHGLAFLEPTLILPGALQRFYPSLQGLVEVHRTTSSLNSLQVLANILTREKGFRCHVTALLALALPGIDANDLNKTQYTLSFIQSVAYSIPMVPLVKDGDGEIHGTSLAMGWVQSEMERMEREGQDVRIDYGVELSDQDEANILKSSTAALGEFILTLLGRVFTLLENLPESGNNARPGGPEENVINALPSALGPIFGSLSPELFELALDKLCNFVSSHVVHQGREAMAWTVNALCKAQPEPTLKAFVPMLIVNIRNEIDHNHAASDRSSGTDYLPRDRALVWNMVMLGMVVVHVGRPMMAYKDELFDIVRYMQEKCRGLPTIHIGNLVHHMLLTLTRTYALDHGLFEPGVVERGLGVADWGRITPPSELTIRWHRPSQEEIQFAVELFKWQAQWAGETLRGLMSESEASTAARKGKNKEWSDEMVRVLQQVRLVLSGMATLFDPERESDDKDDKDDNDSNPLAEVADDEGMRPSYRYEAGYVLKPEDEAYVKIHKLREDLGELLSDTHTFLHTHQEDDVACLTALYTAYRTWITDVGVERSAHPLERHSRLYKSHIAPFSITGLRKAYPRPLLISRAEAYLIQRVKHNAMTRRRSKLDGRLLLDLAASCLSPYTEVRRVAQAVQDAALKTLIGSRPLVVPVVIDKFRAALAEEDHDRIKGAMYTLLYTSLTRTVAKDWRFAPDVVRLYLETASIDKQSIQTLGTKFLMAVVEFAKPLDRVIIVDDGVVDALASEVHVDWDEIEERQKFVSDRRERVQKLKTELGLELTAMARQAHWKIASRCAVLANSLCVRFHMIAPNEFIEFATLGVNDAHPGLRTTQAMAFGSIFIAMRARAIYGHDYTRYLLGESVPLGQVSVEVPHDFTDTFIKSFSDRNTPEYYVDSHYAGWLVWGKSFSANKAPPALEYDEIETSARTQIGNLLTRDWFSTFFDHLKQEPRDLAMDRFRMSNYYVLENAFELVLAGVAAATVGDVRELADEIYGDGSDKHQHRATAEILASLLASSRDLDDSVRGPVWAWAAPRMIQVMSKDLSPESLNYWLTGLHVVLDGKDPRRYREFIDVFATFRVDMASNAAFKDSSKINMLETCILEGGWRIASDAPVKECLLDMVAHLEHPYKSVREAMGRCIATVHKLSYHETFASVDDLLLRNRDAPSSLGLRPYQPTPEFSQQLTDVFERLEKWRHEREPGQQTPSAYTSGSKTVSMWLDATLSSHECTVLVPFFPAPFMEQLLHMMDVKEDPELMRNAYHVYRHIPNVPLRPGEDEAVVASLVQIGRSAPSWHQRLRALINLQVLYFRNIFVTRPETRATILEAVGDMLSDAQLEVRTYASNTLAGMIRCLPKRLRDPKVLALQARFVDALDRNPMPAPRRGGVGGGGESTPADVQAQIVRRHAAVLGLGALIEAFPYATPPPAWMPEVLATLAARAASDPGIVGKATKAILSEFKKTRHDSWSVDQKYFTTEQLEDLEGVLWKSYFA